MVSFIVKHPGVRKNLPGQRGSRRRMRGIRERKRREGKHEEAIGNKKKQHGVNLIPCITFFVIICIYQTAIHTWQTERNIQLYCFSSYSRLALASHSSAPAKFLGPYQPILRRQICEMGFLISFLYTGFITKNLQTFMPPPQEK